MINWNRFISYIYRYHNGKKCDNAGFAKVSKNGDKCLVHIGLRDIMDSSRSCYNVYLYVETQDIGDDGPARANIVYIPRLQYLGKMYMSRGRGTGQFLADWDDIGGSHRPIMAFNGIYICRDDGSDIFCSSWTDNNCDYTAPRYVDVQEAEHMEQRKTLVTDMRAFEETKTDSGDGVSLGETAVGSDARVSSGETGIDPSDRDYEGKAGIVSGDDASSGEANLGDGLYEDMAGTMPGEISLDMAQADMNNRISAVERLMNTKDKLPDIVPTFFTGGTGDSAVLNCVKITPNDIGLLDMNNWKLGINSFLTHGYYSYRYILLGRLVFDQNNMKDKRYVIGVPGIYSSREKYLADIFGFGRFIMADKNDRKTGRFGYWVTDVAV